MIKIFDTTLRDGEQAPGCTMNLEEKIEIAKQLETLKVDIIEAGFAVCSPNDFESVKSIADTIKECSVCSLARTTRKDIDQAYEALKNAVSPRIHIFIATSPIHMQYKLKMMPDEVLQNIERSVKYAKTLLPDIEFSAEDAMRSDPEFLAKAIELAIKHGATTVNIPDTVGYTTPFEMYERIKYIREKVTNIDKAAISLHCHNDLGMAVANSISGIFAGATQIECTINGIGERAGNAALEEIVMAIKTRNDIIGHNCKIDTHQLYRTSKLVYNTIGQTPSMNKPIVGTNAFSHEAGIHQHGVLAERATYEIMTPESVGISQNKFVLGKHSGRHAVEDRLKELGYILSPEEMDIYLEKFKTLCDRKKSVTDNDLDALISNGKRSAKGKYQLEFFNVHTTKNASAICVIKLRHGDKIIEEVSLGDGPINASYNAIDKITGKLCDALLNYSIHSVSDGNDALGEVTVKLRSGNRIVTGRGLSTDIIESSILAYIHGINKLIEE